MMTIEDIKRLNHIKYTALRSLVQNPHSFFYCICSILFHIGFSLLKWKRGNLSSKEILLAGNTINNIKAFQPIIRNLPEEKYTLWGMDISERLPGSKICLYSLINFHLFIILYLKSSKEDREMIRFFYWDFFTTCGIYKVLENELRQNSYLKMIVLANDHSLINRILVELAENLKIKSLYIQHASVTEAFPPLRFDYAFLDGIESYEKYKAVGNMRGYIFLSGSPRFDAFHNYKKEDKEYEIGIALNELDSEDQALNLCLYLKEHYSTKIIVRPHPGMLIPNNLLFHEDKFTEHGFAISDPRKDLSYVFLADINVMIANESGIHLDAALTGVPSLLYNFSDNQLTDWYSYIKKGLVKKCDSFDEVVQMLDMGYHLPVEIVRYYVASFKTIWDGRVGEMIAEFIRKEVLESETSALNYMDSIMIDQGEYAVYRS